MWLVCSSCTLAFEETIPYCRTDSAPVQIPAPAHGNEFDQANTFRMLLLSGVLQVICSAAERKRERESDANDHRTIVDSPRSRAINFNSACDHDEISRDDFANCLSAGGDGSDVDMFCTGQIGLAK